MVGRVWIVGAGPGAPDLLTLRALRCLEQADVVIHDRLIDAAVLDCAPPGAERINVGKHPHGDTWSQEAINALLIDRARRGSRVVRLKGGDPLIFGRGAEEAHALKCAGIPFEIVPGLSSALAAPAVAGIPLTHRGVAHSFTVVTGIGVHGAHLTEGELERLAGGPGTLVFLMGVRRLEDLVEALLRYGRSPCEPCAIVMHATWPSQRTLRAPLRHITGLARAEGVTAPAVIIVGQTVELALDALDTDYFGRAATITSQVT